MTASENRSSWIGYATFFVIGLVVAWFVVTDPVGLRARMFGSGESSMSSDMADHDDSDAAADHVQETLWTCPMHPHILETEPGQCPVCSMTMVEVAPVEPAETAMQTEGEILFYRHPMDPTISSPVPAEDEMGMAYVPVYASSVDESIGGGTTIRIDPGVVQNMNVQSAAVERRDLQREIRTVGYLEYDQERMVSVTTKYSGWVEKVYANYVGEEVTEGQPLFEIYSPELVQTEQELLSAIEYMQRLENAPADALSRAHALVEAARTRLRYWDISPQQIEELERSGEIFRTLQVVAPTSGVIMQRARGLEGMAISPGTDLFHIADLSKLWLSVEVFENQVAWIEVGTPAEVSFTYFPGEAFAGKVRFIEPEFSERTRTLRVKLEVPNTRDRLKSGMFATVVFRPTAARDALTVPMHAVLRTGQRNVVVVDLGEGRFSPREVVLGHQGDGFVEVLDGLADGDRVVTSAQFLLDSEASLQEAIQKMIASNGGG